MIDIEFVGVVIGGVLVILGVTVSSMYNSHTNARKWESCVTHHSPKECSDAMYTRFQMEIKSKPKEKKNVEE